MVSHGALNFDSSANQAGKAPLPDTAAPPFLTDAGGALALSRPHFLLIKTLFMRRKEDRCHLFSQMGPCLWERRGCTEPTATNFDPLANVYDPTHQYHAACRFDVTGCANPSASNFDSAATVSAPCRHWHAGCTDQSALNYVPDAEPDALALLQPGCTFAVPGCTVPLATNFDSLANVEDGGCYLPGFHHSGPAVQPAEVLLISSGTVLILASVLALVLAAVVWRRRTESESLPLRHSGERSKDREEVERSARVDVSQGAALTLHSVDPPGAALADRRSQSADSVSMLKAAAGGAGLVFSDQL